MVCLSSVKSGVLRIVSLQLDCQCLRPTENTFYGGHDAVRFFRLARCMPCSYLVAEEPEGASNRTRQESGSGHVLHARLPRGSSIVRYRLTIM